LFSETPYHGDKQSATLLGLRLCGMSWDELRITKARWRWKADVIWCKVSQLYRVIDGLPF
jgi:hypothetical protein